MNLNDLSNLSSIGLTLSITYNDVLANLNGLIGLTSIGLDLSISHNNALLNINGLSNLTDLGEDIRITFNDNLINIDGLRNINEIPGVLALWHNDELTNLNGLSGLNSVIGDLQILNNISLDSFCGLFNLMNNGGPEGITDISDNALNPTQQEIVDGGPCVVGENLKIFLEGPYNASNMNSNVSFPLQSPFQEDPVIATLLSGTENDIVDWILIQLRDKNNSSIILESRSGLLKTDGSVFGPNGFEPPLFSTPPGLYYISVKHRNHLSVMSAEPVYLGPN